MAHSRILFISVAAFIAPVFLMLVMNADKIQQNLQIDPRTAKGKVLFFTAPNR